MLPHSSAYEQRLTDDDGEGNATSWMSGYHPQRPAHTPLPTTTALLRPWKDGMNSGPLRLGARSFAR